MCQVCRARHRDIDPLAVRALAASGMGKQRAAESMGFAGHALRKAIDGNPTIAQAWEFGRLDAWRRIPAPRAPKFAKT